MFFGKHFVKDWDEESSEILLPNYKTTKLKSNKTIQPYIRENVGYDHYYNNFKLLLRSEIQIFQKCSKNYELC